MVVNMFFFRTPPRKLTWLAGTSQFLIGDTSPNGGWFSIVIRSFPGVVVGLMVSSL